MSKRFRSAFWDGFFSIFNLRGDIAPPPLPNRRSAKPNDLWPKVAGYCRAASAKLEEEAEKKIAEIIQRREG